MPTTPTAATTPNLLHPAPDFAFPSPPAGFMPPSPRDFLGFRPTSREVAAASTVVADLAHAGGYEATFGSAAPAAAGIIRVLELGLAWRSMRDRTETWAEYVKAQDAMAWKDVLTVLAELRPVFLAAVAKTPALASKYPGLVEIFEAPKLVTSLGIVTRKKNAKARAAAEAAATAAPMPTEPAEAPAEAPVAPTKTITVNA